MRPIRIKFAWLCVNYRIMHFSFKDAGIISNFIQVKYISCELVCIFFNFFLVRNLVNKSTKFVATLVCLFVFGVVFLFGSFGYFFFFFLCFFFLI